MTSLSRRLKKNMTCSCSWLGNVLQLLQPYKKANEILVSKCAECAKCRVYTHDSLFLALHTPLPWAPSSFPAIFRLSTHIIKTHYATLNYTQYCRPGGTSLCFQLISVLIVWKFCGHVFWAFWKCLKKYCPWHFSFQNGSLLKVTITRYIGFQISTNCFWIILQKAKGRLSVI